MTKSRFKPLKINNIITHGKDNAPNIDKYNVIGCFFKKTI